MIEAENCRSLEEVNGGASMAIGRLTSRGFLYSAPIILPMVFGCSSTIDGPEMLGIEKAQSIVIEYRLNGEYKKVAVSDGEKVKEILETISIHHTEDRAPGWICFNHFVFRLGNEKEVGIFLAQKQILDRPKGGLVYLNDTKFHDKINEILTKHEGKKIDVLEDNK